MQRNATLDSLKVILAIMVVGLHGHFLRDVQPGVSYFLENYLFRIAVPIFFMVNGYYFFRLVTEKEKVRVWVKRILTIYVTWSVVYLYYIWPRATWGFATAMDLLTTLTIGYWHLWYLMATVLAGALIYLLRNVADKVLSVILLGLYTIGLFMQYAGSYHLFQGSAVDELLSQNIYYRNFLFFGLPMFGAGYLFAKTKLSEKMATWVKVVLLLLGSSLLVFECLLNLHFQLSYSVGFDMLLALPIICSGLFLLAVASKRRTTSARLTEVSAVIYFIHPLFLLNLHKVGVSGDTNKTLIAIIASLLVSPLIIWLNDRWRVFL